MYLYCHSLNSIWPSMASNQTELNAPFDIGINKTRVSIILRKKETIIIACNLNFHWCCIERWIVCTKRNLISIKWHYAITRWLQITQLATSTKFRTWNAVAEIFTKYWLLVFMSKIKSYSLMSKWICICFLIGNTIPYFYYIRLIRLMAPLSTNFLTVMFLCCSV